MPDDQVTISTKSFAFHYVTKTTGEIDGLSFLTQTEDAINDVGNLAQQAVNQSAVSGQKVDQAVSTANTALQNSNTALLTANQARDDVVDLSTEVSQLSQNVSTAVSQSQSAVSTAKSANTKSDQAVQDSQTAINTANEAKTTAQQAVLDTSAAEERINQAVSQAQQYATSAQNSSQSASTSMANSAISEQNAERWATWMGSEEDPDQTVDGTDCSAKWWAQHAEDIVNDVVHISAQTLTSEQKSQVWTNIGLQTASTSTGGVILITTQKKITTGTDDASAVTPLSLNSNAVLYSKAQTLTDEQKQQARDNIGAMSSETSPSVPTGTLLPFAGTVIPDGYLPCNGANVSRTDYANLFAAIGTKWGEGDGSTTFTLPNFNDRFIEGTTDTEKVGQYLEAGAPNITGNVSEKNAWQSKPIGSGCIKVTDTVSAKLQTGPYCYHALMSIDASLSNIIFGSSKTIQPSAYYAFIIIKT